MCLASDFFIYQTPLASSKLLRFPIRQNPPFIEWRTDVNLTVRVVHAKACSRVPGCLRYVPASDSTSTGRGRVRGSSFSWNQRSGKHLISENSAAGFRNLAFSVHARIKPDRLLQSVFSSLTENLPLKSHTECEDLFKPRKGEPTHRADNQANCLGGAILF